MTVRASDLKRPLASRLRDDRERLRVQGSTATLARSGMSVTAEDEVTVDGDFVVDGTLNVTGAAVIGGTLSLPAGIINNDALAQPVVPDAANVDTSGFSLTAAFAEKLGVDIVVPAGCSRALFNVAVWMQAYNANTTGGSDGTGSDYIYVYAKIGGTAGRYNADGVSGNGGTKTTSAGLALSASGLTPGGTVRLGAWGSSQYTTMAVSAYNQATLTASIIWLR